MHVKLFNPVVWIGVAILIFGTACASGESPNAEITPLPPTEPPPATSTSIVTEEPVSTPLPVNQLQDVKSAVIYIESLGRFLSPEFGTQASSQGSGSGFIIDPSGIAITSNQVVTGATQLKVRIGDETSPRNAEILNISDCSGLAIIDIEGDGYDYLNWFQEPIEDGMDMFVAGYSLEDAEFSLTSGVISAVEVEGNTPWTSLDSVMDYSIISDPGNAGGPVVDSDGSVIAVHTAGNPITQQAVGISRDQAIFIIEELTNSNEMNSIGVNGYAVSSDDDSVSGIWVVSVQPSSPAEQVGLEPGDIITVMEDLNLATDGTMAVYCDLLSSHEQGDPLSIRVKRWPTGETLEGQIYGRELSVTEGGDVVIETTPGGSSTDIVNPDASEPGEVYFSTEFDAGLGNWAYYLTRGEEKDFTAQTADDRLQIDIQGTDTWVYLLNENAEYADVRIDTVAENRGNNNNNVSLICRESELGWYEFNIANNGLYYIYWFDDESTNNYIPLFSGGSRVINMGKDINEYTAICDGEQLTLLINGEEIRTVTHDRLTIGKVGLSVSSFDFTPVIIEFDNFRASVP